MNKKIIIFAIVFLVFAIILDVLVRIFSIPLIPVDDSFIITIFSALVTIGVLGITILSVVINSSAEDYLGIKIKKIINFNTSEFKLNNLVIISFFSIALSILFYSLQMINTIIIVCLFLIVFITYNTVVLWNYLSKEDELYKAIEREITYLFDTDLDEMLFITRILNDALQQSVKDGKSSWQKNCLNLLGRIRHEYKKRLYSNY